MVRSAEQVMQTINYRLGDDEPDVLKTIVDHCLRG